MGFRNSLQFWHIIVVVAVIVLLFGVNKLPALARSVGQSLKILKAEVKDLQSDSKPDATPPADNPSEPPRV